MNAYNWQGKGHRMKENSVVEGSMASSTHSTHLSDRGNSYISYHNVLAKAWKRQLDNPYHPERNPDGIINMGTSENRLASDLISSKITEIQAEGCLPELTRYTDFTGTEDLRKAIARFYEKYFKACESIDPKNLMVLNGCGAVIECLAHVIADEGDGFLIPSPFYGGFAADLESRAHTRAIDVPLTSEMREGDTKKFQLTVARLEEAYEKAQKENINIRGLILCNPQNPLGDVYSKDEMTQYLQFADRYNLHVIVDEIYLLSVFGEGRVCNSVLSLEDLPNKERVHMVWGFSKDFALSGFRCGVLHSWSSAVKKAINLIAYFHSVPALIQQSLTILVSDFKWLDEVYFPTNRKRLKISHDIVADQLRDLDVEFLERESGLYIWTNLSPFLGKQDHDGELALFNRLINGGLYITPGFAFRCVEHGWFRIIFTIEPETLELAMTRFRKILHLHRKASRLQAASPLSD